MFEDFLLQVKCVEMKLGLVMREYHDLQTMVHRIRSLIGSSTRIELKTSTGKLSDIVVDALDVGRNG